MAVTKVSAVDMNGLELILDADADTSITADTDDQIDIRIAGADDFQFTANTFTAQAGSTIAAQALTATTLDTSGAVNLNLVTDSTSSTSGALIVDGGVGIAKKLFVGTDLDVDGTTNLDVVDIDGAVHLNGALTIGDAAYFIGNATNGIRFNSSDNSVNLLKIFDDGSIQTVTAGTSNVRLGLNAGNSITAGGNYNVVIGDEAGTAITTGDQNVAVGYAALDANTTGASNTAVGHYALTANTTGTLNVAIGDNAMLVNTTGPNNTAVGFAALDANTTAGYGTAVGYDALTANTTGAGNTAVGYRALPLNTTAAYNTAVGYRAMDTNTTGTANVAVGYSALFANTTAANNTALGYQALTANTEGANNTAIGYHAMYTQTTGAQNTSIGQSAGYRITTGTENTVMGYAGGAFITTADNCLLLGFEAGQSGSPGGSITTADNIMVLGNDNISASHIQVDWTVASDQRDKTDFTALDVGLSFVNALEPVTYKWDKRSKYIDKTDPDVDLDNVTHDGTHKENWLDVGFKAQAVEALESAAGYNIADKTNLTTSLTSDGKQYGIQYSKFVPILVKAFQELSTKNDALEARIVALEG